MIVRHLDIWLPFPQGLRVSCQDQSGLAAGQKQACTLRFDKMIPTPRPLGHQLTREIITNWPCGTFTKWRALIALLPDASSVTSSDQGTWSLTTQSNNAPLSPLRTHPLNNRVTGISKSTFHGTRSQRKHQNVRYEDKKQVEGWQMTYQHSTRSELKVYRGKSKLSWCTCKTL